MSGGSLDYNCFRISEFATDLAAKLEQPVDPDDVLTVEQCAECEPEPVRSPEQPSYAEQQAAIRRRMRDRLEVRALALRQATR